MGDTLGDLGGILDTNRQGIIYLSESLSRLHVGGGDRVREEMFSSKVSGNDNGFSFNSARLMYFDLYRNNLLLQRPIVSPIADNAMRYYRFKLLGTFYDDNRNLVNKIAVIPKRPEDPAFGGTIYITEDLWSIHSADLTLAGQAVNLDLLDTLHLRHKQVLVAEPDVYRLLSQSISFEASIFGIGIEGFFVGGFSNYELSPTFERGFFSNEVFKVEEGANNRNDSYWDSVRTVPLTVEEQADYIKKDSLQAIWTSKPYLDSIDRRSNNFTWINLLTGYTYNKSYERKSFTIQSPLTTVQYNLVQGFNLSLRASYQQRYDRLSSRRWDNDFLVEYGFADGQFRAAANSTYRFNRINYATIGVTGAYKQAVQYANVVSPSVNTFYALFYHQNFMKLYERSHIGLTYSQELWNGVYFDGEAMAAHRRALINNTNYSFRNPDDLVFEANDPQDPLNFGEQAFPENSAFLGDFGLRFVFDQKYLSYPKRKFIIPSKWPTLELRYRPGVTSEETYFQHASATVRDNIPAGLYGYSEFRVTGGAFLGNPPTYFTDWQHFRSNRAALNTSSSYLDSYLLMPDYAFSTTRPYAEAHWQHHFEGKLWDRLPWIKSLDFQLVTGGKVLISEDGAPYYETHIGIDNIGISIFRFLRIDYVVTFRNGKLEDHGLVTGFSLN